MSDYSVPQDAACVNGADARILIQLRDENAHFRQENAHLRAVVETQRGVIAALKAEHEAHRALRDNPHVTPLRKDTLEVVYELLGCPLGTSPATRPHADTIVSHTKVAERLGVSAKQVSKHLADMEADGWLTRWQATSINPENGKPLTHYHYAPVEGEAFLSTVAQPGALVERREPGRSKLADDAVAAKAARTKLIEACCPVCRSTDCQIHCAHGHITAMATVEEARPSRPLTLKQRPPLRSKRAATRTERTDREVSKGESAVEEESSLTVGPFCVREDSSPLDLSSDGTYSPEQSSLTHQTVPESAVSAVSEVSTGDRAVGEDSSLTLQAAVAVLVPAVTHHHDAVRMRGGKPKYLSIGRPLTGADIEAHLKGDQTYGAGLLGETPEGGEGSARVQALVWDEDGHFDRLVRAAAHLDRAGLRPVLVQNPANPQRGHLWLLFSAPCAPAWAISAAERLAPELRAVDERFPDLTEKGGARVRLLGGAYVLPDGTRRPVRIAAGTMDGPSDWLEGTTPAAWELIAAAVSDPAILAATFVPRKDRPQQARPQRRLKPGITIRAPREGEDIFARFNAEHLIESMVDVGRDRKFVAPWRHEDTASVHVYDDGHWHDYGPDGRHGRDAFDLWCALQGYWDEARNRPDRAAAVRALRGGMAQGAGQ